MRISYRGSLATAALASAIQLVVGSAAAQNVDSNEIIVTAQKREQNIQDVGQAITALGQEQLEMVGQQDMVGLAKQVPNLGINSYGPGSIIFNIRGVAQNDFADGQEAPIAFYNDEVYVGALGGISGQLFDLERVEVLRGPQGTLFGRNATGGLVQVVTAKPTDELEGYFGVTLGSYNQLSTEGAISGPISDSVNGRFAFTTNNADGYYENEYVSPEGRHGPDLADANFFGLRGQLDFDLSPTNRLLLKAEYLRNDDEVGLPQTYAPALYDPTTGLGTPAPGTPLFGEPFSDRYRISAEFPGLFDREYWNLVGRFEHDFSWGTLTSISSYQNISKAANEDLDARPIQFLDVITWQEMEQASQELRLSGDTERSNWVLGAFWMHIGNLASSQAAIPVQGPPGYPAPFGPQPPSHTGFFNDLDVDSAAIFGQVEWAFNDQFSLIAGARYSSDDKETTYTPFQAPLTPVTVPYDYNYQALTLEQVQALDAVGGLLQPLNVYNLSDTFSGWSGKLELDYTPNENTLIYASINRGLKNGGFGTPNFDPILPAPGTSIPGPGVGALKFENEVLTSYEAGYKLTLDEGRIRFNGSAFYYDYEDYQAFFTIGLNAYIRNYPATIQGAEFEFFANPIDPLSFSVYVTYINDAQIDGYALPAGPIRDNRIPRTPEWSAGANVSYGFDLGFGTLTASTTWKWEDEFYHSPNNSPSELEPSYTTGDVRLSFAPKSENWEVAAFVNNVTDEAYRVYASDFSSLSYVGGYFFDTGTGNGVYAPPRWYGASFTYRFGAH